MENRPNSGVAFKNDKKGNEKAPDLKGRVNVEGVDMDIALWIKQGKNGEFYSISFSKPYKKEAEEPKQEQSDDTPF